MIGLRLKRFIYTNHVLIAHLLQNKVMVFGALIIVGTSSAAAIQLVRKPSVEIPEPDPGETLIVEDDGKYFVVEEDGSKKEISHDEKEQILQSDPDSKIVYSDGTVVTGNDIQNSGGSSDGNGTGTSGTGNQPGSGGGGSGGSGSPAPSPPSQTKCNSSNKCINPGDNLCQALISAASGSTIVVRGNHSNAYTGDCSLNANNTASVNVTVTADTGNNPLIKGVYSFYGRSGWTIDNLDFTSKDGQRQDMLLNFTGGTGWEIKNGEFYGGGGYTLISIYHDSYYGTPKNWKVTNNYLHDNPGNNAHQSSQDHLMYAITGPNEVTNGLISNNLFAGSSHGTTLKIGSTGVYDGDGTQGVTVTSNTFTNNANGNVLVGNFSSATFNKNVFHITGTQTHAYYRGQMAVTNNNNLYFGYNQASPDSALQWWSGNDTVSVFKYIAISTNYGQQFFGPYYVQQSMSVVNSGNITSDPGYPAYNGTSQGCSFYPQVIRSGVAYGAQTCSHQAVQGASTFIPSTEPDKSGFVISNQLLSIGYVVGFGLLAIGALSGRSRATAKN